MSAGRADETPRGVTRMRTAGLVTALLLCCVVNIETTPPLFWDEGWTLALARNWVEIGHYGQLRDGGPAPPGLAASFPVVLPIAASFRVFGVGVWQGRLPGAVCACGTLLLLYALTAVLFNTRAARAAVAIVLLVPFTALHPILLGRQAFAETPMLFYLLAGYALVLRGLTRSRWWFAGAWLMWSMALATKLQALPFLIASVALASLDATRQRRPRIAAWLLATLAGSVLLSKAMLSWWGQGVPVSGLYGVTAFVPFSHVARLRALIVTMVTAVPTIMALWYWGRRLPDPALQTEPPSVRSVRIALFGLVAAWLAWFVLCSVGWERYLFPALLVGAMFVAAMLEDIGALVSPAALRRASQRLRLRQVVTAGAAVGLLPFAVLAVFRQAPTGGAAARVASYLDRSTPTTAVVESYESDVMFLAHRRFHYPPDQLQVDLNRRTYLHENVVIAYDPLRSNPDFLVVGPQNRSWSLYDEVLTQRRFQLLLTDGPYRVFKRERAGRE